MRCPFRPTPARGWRVGLLCLLTGVAGCALPGRSGAPLAAPAAAPAWQAPLPHGGQASDLARWWEPFDDPQATPVLVPLIAAAQAASPTLSAARSRIAQARAARVAAGAELGPSADAGASAQRSSADETSGLPAAATRIGINAAAAWELDLFGANAAARDAAQARLEGAQAQWHEARVAVAAETASQYTSLRACEAQLVQTQQDAASRQETSRLTGLTAKAGFQSPANAALARASAAQGSAQVTQQQQQCDALVKALVALTARDEPALREQLAPGRGRLMALATSPTGLTVPEVPAALLRQRPDLANAERELLAAQGDLDRAQAARLPRITLSGSIGRARVASGGVDLGASTWAIGPVAVSLPLFDGGTRRANVDAAVARREDAAVQYATKLRSAVREVEEALIALDAAARRSTDLNAAAEGFAASLRATEARWQGGLASLFELEDARRSAVAARAALIELQRERVAAWIGLYRALGGGWSAADLQRANGDVPPVAAASTSTPR